MPAASTEIVRALTEAEIKDFTEEISSIPAEYWVKHYPIPNRLLSLRDGKSVHINWPSQNPRIVLNERSEQVPKIWNFICEYTNGNAGRAYIHRLKPNDTIIKHHDKIHVSALNIKKRYHIYLDIPDNAQLYLDDGLVDSPQKFQFTLVDFALERLHYYKNYSDQTWYFIVFDHC